MLVRLGDMSWPEVGERLKKPHALLLPVSAIEEHGYHLPLNSPVVISTYTAETAAEKVMRAHPEISVMVAPTIPYGEVSGQINFPGSVGIEDETLITVVSDLLKGFITQGFRNIIVINGHYENVAAVEIACRNAHNAFRDKKDLGLFAVDTLYLGFPAIPGMGVQAVKVRAGIAGTGHGLEPTTSMMLAIAPDLVHLERTVKGKRKVHFLTQYVGETGGRKTAVVYKTRIKRWDETGVGGDPTMATKEDGEQILKIITDNLADIIVQVVQSEGK